MTLPSSGQIDFAQINAEFGVAANTQRTILDTQVLQLAGGSAGSHGGRISIWDLYGHSWIITYSFGTPGDYWIQVPFSTFASVQLKGGSGGGGGGGMGGHDDSENEPSRCSGGGAGGGGGGGGQLWNGIIGFAASATLQVHVGAGGPGGAGGSYRICDGSWCRGAPGNPGGNGDYTWINANGNRVVTVDVGAGGGGGGGGDSECYIIAYGGNGGAGYSPGYPGETTWFSIGGVKYSALNPVLNTFHWDGTNNLDGSPNGYYSPPAQPTPTVDSPSFVTYTSGGQAVAVLNPGAGSSGSPQGGGAGGAGAVRRGGPGGDGASGSGGYAIVSINNPSLLGSNGPGYGGSWGAGQYPSYSYYVNNVSQYYFYYQNTGSGGGG